MKTFAAVLARVGPRVGMDQQVSGQGGRPLESLAALLALMMSQEEDKISRQSTVFFFVKKQSIIMVVAGGWFYLERSGGVVGGEVGLKAGAHFKHFGTAGARKGSAPRLPGRRRAAVILTHVTLQGVVGGEGLVASAAIVRRFVLFADGRAVRVTLLAALMMVVVAEENVLRAAGGRLLLLLQRCFPAAAAARSGTCFHHSGGPHVETGRRVEWTEQGGWIAHKNVAAAARRIRRRGRRFRRIGSTWWRSGTVQLFADAAGLVCRPPALFFLFAQTGRRPDAFGFRFGAEVERAGLRSRLLLLAATLWTRRNGPD